MTTTALWDCHMHTSFSSDSEAPMEHMIQQAVQLGLAGICFTEHLDPDYPDTPDHLLFDLDIPSYQKTLVSLKEQYREKIDILFGIELGLQPHLKGYFYELLKQFPFDFTIGSSHVVHGFDPYYPEYFQGRDESACYQEYFESVLENIRGFSEMDVCGHIDFVVRYGPNQNREYSYLKYREILDAILQELVKKNVGIELNTGGFAYGLEEPNPCTDIIRRYRQLGGEIITLGADAHTPDRIAFAFPQAAQILKDCGFTHYTVFRERKPEFLPL